MSYVTGYESNELKYPKQMEWSFDGIVGKFDKQSIQRICKLYEKVCSACHSIKRVALRNLMRIVFSEYKVKSLAFEYEVKDGPNDEGRIFERLARLLAIISESYPSKKAARSGNNASYPLELFLIMKARHDVANYLYSLLIMSINLTSDFELEKNMYYNRYFTVRGRQLEMRSNLYTEGEVEFYYGTKAIVYQTSSDLVNFLRWVDDPEMQYSKSLEIKILVFLLFFIILFYIAKKIIWKRIE